MLSEVKKNRSLTFYQPTTSQPHVNLSSAYVGGLSATALASSTYATASTTTGFNNQLNAFLDKFHAERLHDLQTLDLTQMNKPARDRGVYRAWEYERADIEMGGRGSENWTDEECQQIKDNVSFESQTKSRAGVRGAEGHHQRNAADHPEDQADPDNIKFYRSRDEHRMKGHNGKWQNESDKPKTDKDKMLKKTNGKRVFKNELRGIGIATAIGVGVGFTIGFAVSLAQSGVSPDSIKYAFVNGGKSGLASGAQSLVGYGLGRTIGQVAAKAMEGVLSNLGLEITDNLSKMCSMGTIGAITIAVFSTVQLVRLIYKGVSVKEAAIQVGKQALFSLSILAVSIAAQGIFGGAAGVIVSVSVGVIFVTYSIAETVHQRHYSEELMICMIDACKPTFA
jgi:ElaB/YqjD/DUF883 family membrane-anchored ribosome-binding protein